MQSATQQQQSAALATAHEFYGIFFLLFFSIKRNYTSVYVSVTAFVWENKITHLHSYSNTLAISLLLNSKVCSLISLQEYASMCCYSSVVVCKKGKIIRTREFLEQTCFCKRFIVNFSIWFVLLHSAFKLLVVFCT